MKISKPKNFYWPIEDHSIVELYLDQHNIRSTISNTTQSALIQDLFSNEDAFDLVQSFVQNGLFPDEFPIAVKERGKIIIIEGNRRLSALKALNEPDLVPAYRDKIKALQNPGILAVKVVIAPNRDAAIKHIANKHTINYRRAWKPLRQAYFYRSQIENGKSIELLKREYPEHDIPKFIKMLEMHRLAKAETYEDAQIILKVHDERKFPITTLERLYENQVVQDAFGFNFDSNGNFKGTINKREFRKGYKKLIEDIATGLVDSRKTNTSDQIKKYIEDFPPEYKPNKLHKGAFTSKGAKEVKVDKAELAIIARSTKRPQGLYHSSHVPYKLKNTALRILYDELKDINVEKFPNATHDLLRSFLECTLIVFFKQIGEYNLIQKSDKHNPTLGEMLTHIINEKCISIKDENVIGVVKQIKRDYDSPYSLERLNMINHNENWNSTEKDVRAAWGKIESLVKILLNPSSNVANSK